MGGSGSYSELFLENHSKIALNQYRVYRYFGVVLLLLNACVRVADVMTFMFVSLMLVHNVCRICMIIK